MIDGKKIQPEIERLEHSLSDLKKAHDFISDSLVARFFKTGLIWVFEILMYLIFLSGIILLITTVFKEGMFFEQSGGVLTKDEAEAMVAFRVILLIASLLFFVIGLLLRQIRQKNKKVNYVLGLLDDAITEIKKPVENIKKAATVDDFEGIV